MSKFAKLLLGCAVSLAAQPNFSGVWEATSPEHILARIDQQGASFEFTIRAAGPEVNYRVAIGQETKGDIQGLPVTSKGEWDGSALVIRLHAAAQGREVNITERFVLSANGNQIEEVETHKLNDAPEDKQTRTYARRPAEAWVKNPPAELAEAVYKNIQFLKGQPAPEVMRLMGRMTRALGVDCRHCHVPGKPELDDLPAKQTARKMMAMVRAIDTGNFPQTNAVTCWTCHRGSAKPESLPPQ